MSEKAFKIEKGVPVPPPKSGRYAKYPFAKMDIGDSFFASEHPTKVRPAASWWANRHAGFKFQTRKEGDGVRVWRVAA